MFLKILICLIILSRDIWTRAYLNIVIHRCAQDIFRTLAVDMINPLIFETIHNSLNLFKTGRVFREANKQLKRTNELIAYRYLCIFYFFFSHK